MNIIATVDGVRDNIAYEATIENAKAILDAEPIPNTVIEFASDYPECFSTYEIVARIVNKFLKANDGDVVLKSRSGHLPSIFATPAAKQELVMYCFNNNISPDDITGYTIQRKFNVNEIECLEPFHDIILVEKWIADLARGYLTIKNNTWPENATETYKLNYIIRFINSIAREQYYVVEVRPTC